MQKKSFNVRNYGWKKTFFKIIHDNDFKRNISSLDLDNMNDEDIMNILVILNFNEFSVNNLNNYSSDLAKLIIWCQAVVSYHVLIHPYTYRNENGKYIIYIN